MLLWPSHTLSKCRPYDLYFVLRFIKRFLFLFKVRFAALKVLEGFHARLGEDFMVLLPETIPFLAELMEGESRNFLLKFPGGYLSLSGIILFYRAFSHEWCRLHL